MTIETRFYIDHEVWWRNHSNIRHGKIYGVWVERGSISYGIMDSNRGQVFIEECILFPTKEELLKSL